MGREEEEGEGGRGGGGKGEGERKEEREKSFQGETTIWAGYEKGLSWGTCNSLNK